MKGPAQISGLIAVLIAAIGFSFVLPIPPAPGEEINHPRKYKECMNLARNSPKQGFEEALAWGGLGGGEAARHCAATALMGLGQFAEASRRFESLAQNSKRGDREGNAFRAELLAQAAQARLMNGEAEMAEAILTAALKLKPLGIDLMIDRATARAARKSYFEAIDDLNRAIELDPGRADAYAFRASAYRYLDQLDLAGEDAERALELDGLNPEALLERGIIRRLGGDDNGARRDWMKILTRLPDSPAARSAQANLEKMDVVTQPAP